MYRVVVKLWSESDLGLNSDSLSHVINMVFVNKGLARNTHHFLIRSAVRIATTGDSPPPLFQIYRFEFQFLPQLMEITMFAP